jgi:hypothetical protein
MSIAPDLFRSIEPPDVWVHLTSLSRPEDDTRGVIVRLKPMGRRSISVTEEVSRYAPEWSVFRAIAHAIQVLEGAQAPITREMMQRILREAIMSYVEPF